eukprot:gene13103-8949_t
MLCMVANADLGVVLYYVRNIAIVNYFHILSISSGCALWYILSVIAFCVIYYVFDDMIVMIM